MRPATSFVLGMMPGLIGRSAAMAVESIPMIHARNEHGMQRTVAKIMRDGKYTGQKLRAMRSAGLSSLEPVPTPGRAGLEDHQFNRAARWLRNHNAGEETPPAHIAEKIEAQRPHLREAFGA